MLSNQGVAIFEKDQEGGVAYWNRCGLVGESMSVGKHLRFQIPMLGPVLSLGPWIRM